MRENDAISRSAALKEIDWAIDLAMDDEMHHAMCTLGERFKELPALDVVPVVHGRWGEYETHPLAHSLDGFPCSVCGLHQQDICGLYYCPNCGARMDGEAE